MSLAGTKTAFFRLVAVALILGGCGATRPSKYYQLTIPGDAPAGQETDPTPVTLLVGTLFAPDLYREDRIVYSTGDQMGTYEYQRWAEPPTEMIEEVLLRELRSTRRYRAVFAHRSDTSGDFLVRGRLYDFKEVSEENAMVARMTVDFEMRDLKNATTVWTHYYHHDEPVNGKNVPAVVAALDKNVQRSVKEVLESLDQYFASHPAK